MSMSKRDHGDEVKYKVLLVASKDISKEVYKELSYNFISTINTLDELRELEGGDGKDSGGLMYRTALYQKWFRDDIVSGLNDGYKLGIVEMRVEYYEKQKSIIDNIIKENESNIKIVATAKL